MPEQRAPVRPPEQAILSSPYEEPAEHWVYQEDGEAIRVPGRRPASYYRQSVRVTPGQMALFAEEEREDLPFIDNVRSDVKRWREGGYEGATQVTKALLRHWYREDRARRLFFCQLEAVETIIFLNEIRLAGKYVRYTTKTQDEDFDRLKDWPLDAQYAALQRMGVKMATGSGKTVVMSMLTAWAFCNRGQVTSDERFPNALLVVCPNLTIKERLQVLRPEHPKNYYEEFDLVPADMRPLLQSGKVLVTNWHLFQPESPHQEGDSTYTVVNKGPEGPQAFARRVLGELYERAARGGLMVFNDEAHHAWRPNPQIFMQGGEPAVDREELTEATVWVDGLDRLNKAVGVRFCVDLSATPFYIGGSGYVEGSPFPWLVSDFGLVDAIESGIVKIPRLPAIDNTGRPDPKYYRLWEHITRDLTKGEKLPSGKPKPAVVYRRAEGALLTLAGQWKQRYEQLQAATPNQDQTPPVLIIVCDNTDIAEHFYEQISGERKNGDGETVYGDGTVFAELLSNRPGRQVTVRIDSKLLAKAESGDTAMSRQEAAEQLRRIVSTVGKPGEPGEHVRCVVSVAMLNEGWDANNVTHILGLRAFGSQLLCEQVVGRGLRRMDYVPDPQTGWLTEEYVDIYGVPFSLIPFKGRPVDGTGPVDPPPMNHVYAMPEREAMEIRFPVVEGYALSLRRNAITADVAAMERMRISPEHEPVAVFVVPRLGLDGPSGGLSGPGEIELHDRKAFYDNYHLQTIEFEISRRIVDGLLSGQGRQELGAQSRHQLFPQVLRLVKVYTATKVDFRGQHRSELGLSQYVDGIVGLFLAAIRPDESQGEAPLMPILNRYEKTGSTARVNFKTTRPCQSTIHSHINQMPFDTARWEQSAGFYLEALAHEGTIAYYARNDGLNFTIPYEFMGNQLDYEPDFLVRLHEGKTEAEHVTLVLEVKGQASQLTDAKHEAARRWCEAVSHWGRMGKWVFEVCWDPQAVAGQVRNVVRKEVR